MSRMQRRLEAEQAARWQQQDAASPWAAVPQEAAAAPMDDAFAPRPWAEYVPEETPVLQSAARPVQPARPAHWLWPALLGLCVLIWLVLGWGLIRARRPYAAFAGRAAELSSGVFFPGITVDGIDLSGMTRAQAASRLAAASQTNGSALDIQVQAAGTTYRVTAQQIPFSGDAQGVLDRAWAIGRQGFSWMFGTDLTPFDIRWEHTRQIKQRGAAFATSVGYQERDILSVAEWLAGQINREPINAVIESFDFNTRAFTVTRDVPGQRILAADIADRLREALGNGQFTGVLTLHPDIILPKVTSVELQNGFAQLGTFSTQTTRDSKRNTNIALAAQAINGTTVMPGESFSFNQVVGERTAQRGYQMAPAIAGGVTFDEIGGGVCQVSSTLFNAAAVSGMRIVERSPHAWPSSYVDKGLDATVNWPNLDFVFRNEQQTPVFVVAQYQDRQVDVALYGMQQGAGETVELVTELISTTRPPEEPRYQQNPKLMPGTQQELKAARTGYVVDTYRVFLRGGQEYRREKLFTSDYRMVQQVIEYN